MLSSACVIPTPLDQGLNPPKLVVNACLPQFGLFTYFSAMKTPLLHIAAEDSDGDTLFARLFVVPPPTPTNQAYREKSVGGLIVTHDQNLPNRWNGSLPDGVDLCELMKTQLDVTVAPSNVQLIVRVSDQMFSEVAGMQNTTRGLTDENYWVVTCQ